MQKYHRRCQQSLVTFTFQNYWWWTPAWSSILYENHHQSFIGRNNLIRWRFCHLDENFKFIAKLKRSYKIQLWDKRNSLMRTSACRYSHPTLKEAGGPISRSRPSWFISAHRLNEMWTCRLSRRRKSPYETRWLYKIFMKPSDKLVIY